MIATPWTGPVIELQNLSRHFGQTRAVDEVSFLVPRGSVFGYIGPNGAGKTTSMRILATLELPTYGEAYVEGLSSVNDPDKVRKRLGFMPDSFGTYPDTNCAEYLDFFARSHGLIGRERTRRMRWVMDFTGLRALADKPIRGLSKGMRQRLCLGRSLIHDPSVLILDEPAAGLDPRARIELRQIIRALAADGKTILISSHILTELAEMVDRVGIIERGRLLATDSVDGMRRRTRESHTVAIRIGGANASDDRNTAVNMLSDMASVRDIETSKELIEFTLIGGEPEQIEILQKLCNARLGVAEFRVRDQSLEDVFLRVTSGQVQ
ncbi:ABC transporter ATP-binding protein [Stieleria varia]|uniref:Putative ABC transporter ATP-binding protein YbhF n=1 Tax=Stieleria varia TaxID=2528005 RepID=A0A5C6B2X5_9BACT|nr:ABC transporter ATP-binding protein [Stieleria varia]TWU05596.1 putative ABC transporter ATP-binding protein YbhF [Stieleria varia]